MQTLEHERFIALSDGAEILEADHYGEKVLRLPDGSFLKLFRRKRLFSSAAWYPYAQRFADNARALAELGVPCPDVIAVYRVPAIARDIVLYQPLDGQTVRDIVLASASEGEEQGLRATLGSFIAKLHQLGIYFRSLHLGNIVRTPSGALGLIDIADMQIKKNSLDSGRVARNISHILRYPKDRDWLLQDGGDIFWTAYADQHTGRININRLRGRLAAQTRTAFSK